MAEVATVGLRVVLALWGASVITLVVGMVRVRLKTRRPWRTAQIVTMVDAEGRPRRVAKRASKQVRAH